MTAPTEVRQWKTSCVTPCRILVHNRHGLQCKKCIVDGVAYQIETHLNIVEEFVQPTTDDFSNLNIVQFRAQPAQLLLGRIRKRAEWRTRNSMHRRFGRDNAVVYRTGELAVENEKFDNPVRRDLLKPFSVHLERAGRAKNGGPHDIVIRSTDCVERRQQKIVLGIQNSRCLIRSFDQPPETAEVPAFVMRHGRIERSQKQMTRCCDVGEKIQTRRKTSRSRPSAILDREVKAIDLLPGLERDVLTHGPCVLARRSNRRQDRVRVVCIECEKLDDIGSRCIVVMFGEKPIVARRTYQRTPLFLIALRKVQTEPRIHVDEARDIFRAFHIPAHPVKTISNTAQHDSTHVSLLPPPCEEFTTRDPFFNATRVRPPGNTKISFPYRTYGRRSTCLPSKWSSTITGTRERARVG